MRYSRTKAHLLRSLGYIAFPIKRQKLVGEQLLSMNPAGGPFPLEVHLLRLLTCSLCIEQTASEQDVVSMLRSIQTALCLTSETSPKSHLFLWWWMLYKVTINTIIPTGLTKKRNRQRKKGRIMFRRFGVRQPYPHTRLALLCNIQVGCHIYLGWQCPSETSTSIGDVLLRHE